MNQPLPLGESFSNDELTRAFAILDVVPERNPTFAFRMRVPRDWADERIDAMDAVVEHGVLTPLAVFRGPTDEDPPALFVSATLLAREIAAIDVLREQALARGLEVIAIREARPAFADMLAAHTIEGRRFATRMAIAIDGDRAYLLTGAALADRWSEVAEPIGAMIEAFRPKYPSSKRSIEPIEDYTLPGVAFAHPRSYAPALIPGSHDEHAQAELVSRDDTGELVGVIYVEVERDEPLTAEDEHLRCVSACGQNGLAPAGSPRDRPIAAGSTGLRGILYRTWPASLAEGDVEHEVTLIVVATAASVIRAWVIGPSMRGHLHNWALNTRAFEIVAGSLR